MPIALPGIVTGIALNSTFTQVFGIDLSLFTNVVGHATLPIWIFTNLQRPNQLPIVNVVAVLVVLISIVPVYLAYRLTREEGGPSTGRGRAAEAEATAVP